MIRQSITTVKNPTRNIPGIKDTGIPAAFCDAVRVDLPTHSIIYISGKLGTDEDGNIVSNTMEGQCEKILEKLRDDLSQQGATLNDIVRTLIFVTELNEDTLRVLHEVRGRFFDHDKFPASTLVECGKLVRPGSLIEIEAEAVIANTAQ